MVQSSNAQRSSLEVMIRSAVKAILRYTKAMLVLRNSATIAKLTLDLRARRPKTLSGKIRRSMSLNRNEMLSIYADKVRVRDFVQARVGERYLTQSFGTYATLQGVTRESFPRNFVLKANHGSGASVICWDGAPRGRSIPAKLPKETWKLYLIHPDDLDWHACVNLADKWMGQNFYWDFGHFPEWCYKNIPPQLLVEEVLVHDGELPEDYKFFMFDGQCKFLQVDTSRFTGHHRNLFTPAWTPIDAKYFKPALKETLPPPKHLEEMLVVAQALSKGIDFIRVDLYETDEGVKFGELTNYPGGGLQEIEPKSLSIEWAKEWHQNY